MKEFLLVSIRKRQGYQVRMRTEIHVGVLRKERSYEIIIS